MSRYRPEPPASDEIIAQVGYDPHSIPEMDEAELYEYLRGITTHISRSVVRRAVQHRKIRGVRKGRKFLFSKRAAIDWLMASDDEES